MGFKRPLVRFQSLGQRSVCQAPAFYFLGVKMNYLPILYALFSSDSWIFFLIGLIAALIIGFITKKANKCLVAAVVCFAAYIICEVLSNVIFNYLAEIILLFTGTALLGGFVGVLIRMLILKISRR